MHTITDTPHTAEELASMLMLRIFDPQGKVIPFGHRIGDTIDDAELDARETENRTWADIEYDHAVDMSLTLVWTPKHRSDGRGMMRNAQYINRKLVSKDFVMLLHEHPADDEVQGRSSTIKVSIIPCDTCMEQQVTGYTKNWYKRAIYADDWTLKPSAHDTNCPTCDNTRFLKQYKGRALESHLEFATRLGKLGEQPEDLETHRALGHMEIHEFKANSTYAMENWAYLDGTTYCWYDPSS